MSFLGSLGNAAKGVVGNTILPGAGLLASYVDPTPGFSATNVARTQLGKLGGSSTSSPTTNKTPQNTKEDTPLETPPNLGGAGSGYGSGEYDPADLATLDSQAQSLRDMLARSGTYLDQGLTNLGDSYNREVGTANGQRSRALEDYGIQRDDMTNAKTGALGKADTHARTLNDSVRRILGMASGSGSSAYQFAAPQAIAREASQNRNNVLEDYATNDRNITLSENRAKTDFESLLEDLARQRGERESTLRQGILENEQGVNAQLADVESQKQQLLGGSYDSAKAAIAPYQQAINDRQSQLDSLFNQFRNPVLTPKQVNVQKPELRDYVVDRAAINAQNQGGDSQYAPYSNFLKKPQDESLLA